MPYSRTFGYPTEVIEQRFWAKVAKTDTCWLWLGSTKAKGYGQMAIKPRGVRFRWMAAHRVSYVLATGEAIPTNLQLDHLCHIKRCVRPDHLEVVTAEENGRRGREHQFS